MLEKIKQEEIDNKLRDVSKNLQVTKYLEPLNKEKQKELFLKNKIVNPTFKYKKPDLKLDKRLETLKKINIPNNNFKDIYEEKKEDIKHTINILRHLGREEIKEHSKKKYGEPSKELVQHAKDIIQKLPNERIYRYKGSEKVKNEIHDILENHGLQDWDVRLGKKYLTTVYPDDKEIHICERRKFTKNDPKRLAVHEVGVHVLRRYNGKQQPFSIFKTGLSNYLATEEGLALFCEQMTESVSPNHYRDYAGRVIAVKTVCQDKTFRDTYEILKNYGFKEENAFTLTMRAHRGNGYVKDHVYLKGYRKVRDLYLNTNDFMYLYTGKIGIRHIPKVKELIQKGILQKPKTIPLFLKEMKR